MARTAMRFTIFVAAWAISPYVALAQIPSAQGQMPGTLPPAPAVIPPPPPVAPAPVPSVVTPLPQSSYGVPRNINSGPVLGSGITPTIRMKHLKKRIKRRPPRTSGILLIRQV